MNANNDLIRQAMALAGSPAGQQLLKLMQATDSAAVQQAAGSAAAGDYFQVKQNLSQLLQNPEIRKLLEQMGGSYGPDGR